MPQAYRPSFNPQVRSKELLYTRLFQMDPSFQPPPGFQIQGNQVLHNTTVSGAPPPPSLEGPSGSGIPGSRPAPGTIGREDTPIGGIIPELGPRTVPIPPVTAPPGVNQPRTIPTGGFEGVDWSDAGGGILNWLGKNWRDIFSGAGDVGSVLGDAAKGAASGRQIDAFLNNQQDAIRNSQFGTQQNAQMNLGDLDLRRQTFSEDARGTRGRQAAVGNLLQNVQDINLNVPGISKAPITGGLRPSALGPGGREAGAELARQAMLKLMTPDTFTGGELLTPPPLTPIPQASGWETAGARGGLLGNILGAIGSGRSRATQPPPIKSTVLARPR